MYIVHCTLLKCTLYIYSVYCILYSVYIYIYIYIYILYTLYNTLKKYYLKAMIIKKYIYIYIYIFICKVYIYIYIYTLHSIQHTQEILFESNDYKNLDNIFYSNCCDFSWQFTKSIVTLLSTSVLVEPV